MSDTKVFSFGDQNGGFGGNGLAAMLPALLQNRGIDTAALMGLMNNGNGGFFGNNGGFQDIIALIVIAAIFGNGNFGFGGNNNNGSQEGREMIMQTLNRNGVDIAALAQSVNASSDRIYDAITAVSGAICNQSAQMGQSFNQVLTAMLQGNNAITAQICECCCSLKGLVTEQGYQGQLRTVQQTQDIIQNATGNANVIAAKIDAQTQILNDKFCALEMRELQRDIAERDRTIAKQDVIINNGQQTAIFSQMLGQATAPLGSALTDLSQRLAKIECKQPETVTLPYSPVVGVPQCVAAQFGLGYGLNGFPGATGFWG